MEEARFGGKERAMHRSVLSKMYGLWDGGCGRSGSA